MALDELRHRPLVFVDDLNDPVLDAADRRHLEKSLRLRAGSALTVADGNGGWRAASFGPAIEAEGPVERVERRADPIVVGFAPVKGDRSDLVVQKLTELGVDRIVPLTTVRSVVRWDEARTAKNLDRHRRIVREAAMQSRNVVPPVVEALIPLAEFIHRHPDAVLADPAGPVGGVSPRTIAVGPEGGFAPEEVTGAALVGLPGRILRTETAAIVAATLAVAGAS